MAEDFLEEIYSEAYLYTELCELRKIACSDITELTISRIKEIYPRLGIIGQKYLKRDKNEGENFWGLLEKLSTYKGDNIWLLDFLDSELLPKIESYLTAYNSIKVEDDYGLCLESSRHGFLTIWDKKNERYFHSKIDPMIEARDQVVEFYSPDIHTYVLCGCGLGYLAYQLYKISDGAVKIVLFECNEWMVSYAKHYGVLDWIPEGVIEILIGKDILPFLLYAEQKNSEFHIFQSEIEQWDEKAQEVLKRLYTNQCTTLAFGRQREINFFYNIESEAKPVSLGAFPWKDTEKQYIIVGGGPSVDDCIEFLREQKGKKTIFAVGTVFRKLMQEGIEPDMVVVMDPLPILADQFQDMWEENIPLLMASTAYWKCNALYKGDKYLAPVLTGRCKPANEYADGNPGGGWDCGGTVLIMAVRAAISFGGENIYLCGADFAYPNGYTYPLGVEKRIQKDVTKLIPVKGVSGDIVYTEEVMNTYRHRMEELIAEMKDIRFINLSRIGAKIEGCETVERG